MPEVLIIIIHIITYLRLMGIDVGFDFYPSLNERELSQWQLFLDAVEAKYKDDPVFRKDDKYISFAVGEHPQLDLNGMNFRRFSSKICRTGAVEKYVEEIYKIAKEFFPTIRYSNRVHYWNEMGLCCGFDVNTRYDWNEVHNPSDKHKLK